MGWFMLGVLFGLGFRLGGPSKGDEHGVLNYEEWLLLHKKDWIL